LDTEEGIPRHHGHLSRQKHGHAQCAELLTARNKENAGGKPLLPLYRYRKATR